MRAIFLIIIMMCIGIIVVGFQNKSDQQDKKSTDMSLEDSQLKKATFAGGCFWCIESDFEKIDGVVEAVSGYASVADAQKSICAIRDISYEPIPENHRVYTELFELYSTLHDSFGTNEWEGRLNHVMKKLIDIREAQR